MRFLFAMHIVTAFASIQAMMPESADRLEDVEIRLVEVLNNTQEPITMHAENGETTLLAAGQALELNRAMVLLTQEELLKMDPYVEEQVSNKFGDDEFEIRTLADKKSKTWQYNEILQARREQPEQLALTTKEKQSYTPSNKPLSLGYGNSLFHSQFLHFTDPAINRICISISQYVEPSSKGNRGSTTVALSHNGCTKYNTNTTEYTAVFFHTLCTNFSIILQGPHLKESHLNHANVHSLYDLCLKSCLQNKTKDELQELVNPKSPVAPTIKSHIRAYLSFLNNTSCDKGQ